MLPDTNVSRNLFELPSQILIDRRPTLVKYAGALRARGKGAAEIHAELLKVNRERCCPPLTSSRDLHSLKRIADWASTKPAGNAKHTTMSKADAEAFTAAVKLVDEYPWSGIASHNARIVACALFQLMQDTGKTEIAASCRNIAEVVGLSYAATAAALRRLCGVRKDRRADVPVLFTRIVDQRRVQDAERLSVQAHAYLYKFNSAISAHTYSHGSTKEPSHTGRVVCVDFARLFSTVSHDAFRKRGQGLTRSAALVYAVLPCDSIGAIAEQTGLSRRTVYNALYQLHSAHLAVQDEHQAWVRTDETLDAVAKRRGTAGYGEKQRKLHQLQRESFNAWLVRPRGKKAGDPYVLREEAQQPPESIWWEDIEWRDAA